MIGEQSTVEAVELSKTFKAARAKGASRRSRPVLVRAVDAVSFRAEPGRILGLLGPNGAGKTTTMRILATTVTPSGGTASVAGHDIRRDPIGVRRSIGVLTANIGLYGRLTARENVAYFATLYGMDRQVAARRIDQLFRLLEMGDFADRRADGFSTGMKQKVAIARAYMRNAQLLILDEPTAALDARAEYEVFERFKELSDGKTGVLISHRFSSVRMADRILVLENGAVESEGTHDELLAMRGRYAELFELQAAGYR